MREFATIISYFLFAVTSFIFECQANVCSLMNNTGLNESISETIIKGTIEEALSSEYEQSMPILSDQESQSNQDTIPPGMPPDTMPAPVDALSSDTLTTEKAVEQKTPDTLRPSVITSIKESIPSPPIKQSEFQEQAVSIRQINPYDERLANTAPWDSLLFRADHSPITRIFSAKDLYGDHLLPANELFKKQEMKKESSDNLATIWIILSLLLIGLAHYFFPVKFREMILANWESRYYTQLERESGLMSDWVSFFMYFNFLQVFVLLVYQSMKQFGYLENFTHIPVIFLFIYIWALTALFYIVKYILIFSLAWVFKTRESTESYFRNIMLINQFAGLIILPILIINEFNPSELFLYLAIGILLLINLFKVAKGSVIGLRNVGFSAYYLILYLCAIEIAPVLLLIKVSKVYLLDI